MSLQQTDQPKMNSENDTSVQSDSAKMRKMMNIKVIFLDNSSHVFQVQCKALGRMFFDKVCKFLNLLESDYFGLEYEDDSHTKYWLDGLKPLCRQVGLTSASPTFHFCVKFYTPDPVQLEDEFTRYLFSLQIKRDLSSGCLQCNDNTAAVMISYIVQAEFGDYDPQEFPDHSYLSPFKFVPYQDAELERKIMENHKKHIGQTPAEAELNLLETARRCELYGIRMTPAKDSEGVPLNLAVAHLGVLVFQNYTKINTFSWAKIRKLSFKRKRFLIKLHPEGYGYYKDTVEFFFEGRNECKNFWKKCIENHTFFRCTDAKKGMRQKPKLFSRGSSFRYSGRTQVQVSEYVRENFVQRSFQRSTSLRTGPSSPTKPASGTISPQPVLPVSTSFSFDSVSAGGGETSAAPQSLPPANKTSISEPTTPYITSVADSPIVGNGEIPRKPSHDSTEHAQDVISPDSDHGGGFQTPEYFGQDTDDNISHDSYHVVEKDAPEPVASERRSSDTHRKETSREPAAVLANGAPKTEGKAVEQLPDRSPLYRDVKLEVRDKSGRADLKPAGVNMLHIDVEMHVTGERNTSHGEINGHVSPCVEQGEDADDDVCLEDSTSSYTDGEPSLGVPSFYSESFGSLSESNLWSHKKAPADKEYFIAKELLMTERTYRKDLEILDVVFRDEFHKQGDMPNDAVEFMLSAVDPLYEMHCFFLRELEQRMAFWEGKRVKAIKSGIKGVGDIFIQQRSLPDLYATYVEQLPQILEQLSIALQDSERFADFYQCFEAMNVCYLPLTSLLLRPLYRLSHYCSYLKALTGYYGTTHFDYDNCFDALIAFEEGFSKIESKIPPIVNTVKLMELERSLAGFPSNDEIVRIFIREGCLQKLSKSGNHQCMMFLFSDVLLYAKQVLLGKLHFKVHSCLPLSELRIEEAGPREGANYCFKVSKGDRCLLLSASTEKERGRWLDDLNKALKLSQDKGAPPAITSQMSVSSDADTNALNQGKPLMHHVNTSVHVCWHRNISIGKEDLLTSTKHVLSGFLLRKFTNSSGWQKLWVVLSNLCLFFYKSYQDENPLASLPLAGYRVLTPAASDGITKDYVFKLQYKSHNYFFRAENKHFLDRWMEVIQHCTLAGEEKTRL